jgi:hypothetical protein
MTSIFPHCNTVKIFSSGVLGREAPGNVNLETRGVCGRNTPKATDFTIVDVTPPLQQFVGVQRFSISCAVAVLIFRIAGLLYLLFFEHVDNLGAYSIPSETGFLIPSGYNS